MKIKMFGIVKQLTLIVTTDQNNYFFRTWYDHRRTYIPTNNERIAIPNVHEKPIHSYNATPNNGEKIERNPVAKRCMD